MPYKSSPPALGEFEQLVLLALLRLGERAYGIAIRDEIVARTGRRVSLGAVYKALIRLETKAMVRSWMGEPTAERGGRRKKHYEVLPAGRRTVEASLAAIRSMAQGIEPLPEIS